ncbi:28S ribosomal protein S9, mitochondrial [Oncorhynchus tshawytscha]|uniref:28S ribosomal protein S9, mitochondrial n=1 Tax=Oncorhynchus tshawytscha TaxID=74940 RepID=UPI001C3CAEE3|nr:28S ribosomal protein S9, mitochondrial [Oncorhynchus tshawytscha]
MAASCGKTVLSRQLCVSAVHHRKNLAAAGPEKFSEEFIKKQLTFTTSPAGGPLEFFAQSLTNWARQSKVVYTNGLTLSLSLSLIYEYIYPLAVQWGADRRPFHFLFYTGKQSYYSLMHDTVTKALAVEKHQDRLRGKNLFTQDAKQISLKEELEELLVETISEHDYAWFIQLMERLLSLPNCSVEEDFVQHYRRQLEIQSSKQQVQPLQYNQHGVAYSTGDGRRKTATGTVLLRDSGSGSISINGTNYVHYFPVLQDRQAGALRLAISRAMLSFLSEGQVETMRQAGLLTPGPRIKERKKPGQEGARRKFTWKKR